MSILSAWIIPLSLFRFDPADATKVDQERRLGSETYNDEISYEFSERSNQEWNASLSGYRATAGSFNMSEFYFVEDIRLRTERNKSTRLSFISRRYQNLINDKADREIRLERQISSTGWYWSLLADGDSVKAFADIGSGLVFHSDQIQLRLDYWSVDHFYNTKTLTEPDRYQNEVYATEFEGSIKTSIGDWNLQLKDHSPVEWNRPSLDMKYHWQERFQALAWNSPKFDLQQVRLALSHSQKIEHMIEQVSGTPFDKSLNHRFTVAGLEWIRSKAKVEDLQIGLRSWMRDAQYTYVGDLPASADPKIVEPDVRRRELAFFATQYRYFRDGSGVQLGLHYNLVHTEQESRTTDHESKLQTAYDWRLAENASMFWNFTWDLDQLARNFPYSDKPFRPWGGGNIQINIVL